MSFPKKVDSGVTAESLLQPSKIAHFIEVLGVFGRKKSLFSGPILPDFGSFLCFMSLVAYFVMYCYSVIYEIWCRGVAFRYTLMTFRFGTPSLLFLANGALQGVRVG